MTFGLEQTCRFAGAEFYLFRRANASGGWCSLVHRDLHQRGGGGAGSLLNVNRGERNTALLGRSRDTASSRRDFSVLRVGPSLARRLELLP
jgi:hypothetical protein